MAEVIYHKSISTLLANDVISSVYNKPPRCDFTSSLMKTLDWSVETLGRECNSTGLCIQAKHNFTLSHEGELVRSGVL